MDIPQEAPAAALREVAELGAQYTDLTGRANALLPSLQESVLAAVRSGHSRSRVRELAGVSTTLFYRWLREGGIEMRRTRRNPYR